MSRPITAEASVSPVRAVKGARAVVSSPIRRGAHPEDDEDSSVHEQEPNETHSVDRLYNMAVGFRKKSLNDKAQLCFELALEKDASHVPSMTGLASLLQFKNPEESKRLFSRATSLILGPKTLPGEALARLSSAGLKSTRSQLQEDVVG
mmetsp:Transcript_80629/g.216029  ORF Transcript_80629/g.216029 Transcript_80629/m.216029 type:complete len:149 (+) Transcript_80629:149-595(+)|eukprot:CAMPEP_0113729818 /NCGR_PEP_ID=MMETSP0038_2-20120614/42787_1 /TAXON_ID=2898 /ORGANISM="Cryptomonas paramecium" /LENGTH=148 /DNA_ID=CAMNT_0000661755 /DNA_START=55 /DNA_END=501 /DNA_ORIENTATION=- /assembly_acc=CAM_ASM_000170